MKHVSPLTPLPGEVVAPPREPILTPHEVAARAELLVSLQAELEKLGHRCVLARTRRLVLRASPAQHEPSGPTNPQLHVLTGTSSLVTTDGTMYRLPDGLQHPASDPAAAAMHLSGRPLPVSAAERTVVSP